MMQMERSGMVVDAVDADMHTHPAQEPREAPEALFLERADPLARRASTQGMIQ